MSSLLAIYASKLLALRQLSAANYETAIIAFRSGSSTLCECSCTWKQWLSRQSHVKSVSATSMTRIHRRSFHNRTLRGLLAGGNCTFRTRCQNIILHICVCASAWLVLCFACKRNVLCRAIQQDDAEYYDDPFEKSKDARLIKCNNVWIPKAIYDANNRLLSVKNFEARKDDIFVASFPKSGTTWVQQIIYLLLNGVDIEESEASIIEDKFPYLEYVWPGISSLAKMTQRRLLKTHLPYSLLPDQLQNGTGKIVYVVRNPRDVCVSYFHFRRMLAVTSYSGQFIDFFRSFVTGKVPYGPWTYHVMSYLNNQRDINILIVTYEQLHKQPEACIEQIASFLGVSVDRRQVAAIADYCKFDRMSANPTVNYSWWDSLGLRRKQESKFMRKGIVGDWKNYFTPSMVTEMDDVIQREAVPAAQLLSYE